MESNELGNERKDVVTIVAEERGNLTADDVKLLDVRSDISLNVFASLPLSSRLASSFLLFKVPVFSPNPLRGFLFGGSEASYFENSTSLPTREKLESVDSNGSISSVGVGAFGSCKKDGIFPTGEVSEVAGQRESFHFDAKNRISNVEGTGIIPSKEDCNAVNRVEQYVEMPIMEKDVVPIIAEEKDNLTANDVKLLASNKRNGRLHAGDLVKKIMSLPIEERFKVLDLLECDDKSLTISDYNDILTALVKAGEYDSAVTLFSELIRCGVSPDSWSFSVMVQCWCKKNEPDEAKRVLDDMVLSGYHPNVVTFTILVNCLCKRGRMKKAFEVFEIMSHVGCEPTIRTYNCLIGGLCYVGRLEEALQLLKKIKDSPKTPDIYTFTLVIDGFCKVGQVDKAMELLRESQEMGLVPTIVTFNALLNGYCKEGRPLEALHLLREMQDVNCLPDFISYSIVLQGLLKRGELSAAWKTFKKMEEAGFQADGRSVNTLLRCFCRQSTINSELLKDAKYLFKKIKEMNCELSPYTYSLMVQALAKGGEIDEALTYLHEMVKTGYSPRMMTYNILLRVLCGEGRVYVALDVLILMMERDTIPSGFSFSILLNEFSQQERQLDAFAVYAAAVKRGVVPHWKQKKVTEDEKEMDSDLQRGETILHKEEQFLCTDINT
ncbi:uncharacterized protein [Typha latifolia]|uniref:uncharacterized protein n=1 Tax=Typha latifolia TaxID=4733 RepID=UPI003C2D4A3C